MKRKTILLRAVGTIRFDAISISALGISAGAVLMPTTAHGQIFVTSPLNDTVGEYTTSGTTVNASLVTGLSNPFAIAVSGSDLFVTSFGSGYVTGTIGEYTTSGATVNASLASGLSSPVGIAMSGSDLFVTNYGPGTIGEYTTSGATVNASLVSGLNGPSGIAVSGSNLFVANEGNGTIGKYALGVTPGTIASSIPTLVSGLSEPDAIAVSGSDLFVANYNGNTNTIGEYTTSGATVNASLVSGLGGPDGIAVSGADLFVASYLRDTIGEYTTSGATVNASLVPGLYGGFAGPTGIAVVVPPTLTWNNTGGASPNDGQTWDISNNNNWNNGSATTVYTDGSNVIFNDSKGGGSSYAVTLNITVSPNSVTVDSAGNYTISGTGGITGVGSLTKMGTGTLTLSTDNTYAGGTFINNGVINFSNIDNLGTSTVTFNGGTLQYAMGNHGSASLLPILLNAGGGTIDTNGNVATLTNPVSGVGGLTKAGAGNLTLSATETYTGDTTVNTGTLEVSNFGSVASGNISISTGGILTIDSGGAISPTTNLTVNGTYNENNDTRTINSLAGSGTVTLNGVTLTLSNGGSLSGTIADGNAASGSLILAGGTLTLSGSNTYSGGTVVNAGELLVTNASGSATGSGNVTLNGGILASGPTGSISGNVLAGSGPHTIAPGGVAAWGTMTIGGLTSNSLTALNFDLGYGTGPEIANGDLLILGTGVNIGAGTLLAFNGTSTIGDDYRLIGGSIGGINVANFTLPAAPTGEAYSLSNDGVDPGFIDLVVTTGGGVGAGPANLTWNDSSTNNSWDTGTSANWNNGSATTVYHAQDKVTFDDSNNGNYSVTLNTVESPDSMVVNNSAGNYTISGTGSIAGIGSLTKSGTGTLTLSTQNTFTGGTTVNAGELSVANTAGSATGTGNVTLNGGTLASGTTGSISGNVLAGGGSNTIAPGGVGTVGSLTIGGLTSTNLTTLNFDLGTGTGQITNGDLLTLGSGTVSIASGTPMTFGGTPTIGDDYRLIGGSISGINAANFALPTAPTGEAYSLSNNGVDPGYIDLVVLAEKGALSISSGTVRLPNNVTAGTPLATSNVNLTSLSITGNGTLDIGNNRIIINYGGGPDPIASIEQWIANGASGATGPAIISSDIATDDTASGLSYAIGYADGADGLVAGLPSGEIEIMFTLLGDANLDGTVNAEDFTQFSHNLGQAGTTWDDGDFNYDGTVNSEDFTPFSANLGKSATLAAQAGVLNSANGINSANVPEPACAAMTVIAGLGILRCRRRSCRRVDSK